MQCTSPLPRSRVWSCSSWRRAIAFSAKYCRFSFLDKFLILCRFFPDLYWSCLVQLALWMTMASFHPESVVLNSPPQTSTQPFVSPQNSRRRCLNRTQKQRRIQSNQVKLFRSVLSLSIARDRGLVTHCTTRGLVQTEFPICSLYLYCTACGSTLTLSLCKELALKRT